MSTYTLNVIWKFPIQITDYQEIEAPTAFKPVHVGLDPAGQLCIWALVDNTKNKRRYVVYIVGTGQTLDYLGDHVGSVVVGQYVWHVFIGAILV